MTDYDRIELAIAYIRTNLKNQPTLEEIAAQVHLSPFHFQKLFAKWAGISPKRFLQVLTLNQAKPLIAQQKNSILSASESVGLRSRSRLYDHCVNLEAVTPKEYKQKKEEVLINYGLGHSPFGSVFIAQTTRGICKLSFILSPPKLSNPQEAMSQNIKELTFEWPRANVEENQPKAQSLINQIFQHKKKEIHKPLSLHVRGTNFQVHVWRTLLKLSPGKLYSYQQIANAIGKPKASRAVGTAIGKNPIALIIPCHRVIRQNGELGGYRWGLTKKHVLLTFEQAHKV